MKAFVILLLFFTYSGICQARTVCVELPPKLSEEEFDTIIAGQIERGEIPPWDYKQPKNIECHIEPQDGFVADKATALLVAEAIMKAHLGHRFRFEERVFEVNELPNRNWRIQSIDPTPGMRQRVPTIEISRHDARILRLWVD